MPDTPSNAPESNGNAEEWVSVARFAFMAGVSERTVRRRCEAGKLRARLETTGKGVAWLIDPDEVRPSADGAAIGAATQNETGQRNAPESAAKVRTGADTALLDHVLEENRRLWLALEAAQQSEAVTKAALREALKAMPKQLSAGATSGDGMGQNGTDVGTSWNGHASARNAQNGPQNSGVGSYGADASNGAKTQANGEESGLSYGDIADELERMMNQ